MDRRAFFGQKFQLSNGKTDRAREREKEALVQELSIGSLFQLGLFLK